MKRIVCFLVCISMVLAIGCNEKTPEKIYQRNWPITDAYKSKDIEKLLIKVNKYFQENMETPTNSWDDAVYHSGNIRAFMHTGVKEFYDYSYGYATKHHFFVNNGANTINGDFYCISQLYIDLYRLTGKDYMLKDVLRNADFNADSRTTFDWVDLLYMSLPVFVDLTHITGDTKYIDDALRAYEKAREIMWDEEDSLWYRDARFVYGGGNPDSVTPSGKKVYWSRGNGWAFSALAKSLEYLDKDHIAYEIFANDLKLMADALKERQRDDGTWNANLDDPEHFGGIETSGTVMFMYGYIVGIRLGILDFDTYFPIVQKIYEGLKKHAISKEGRLLYVQPGSDSPQRYANYHDEDKRREQTCQFAVGVFVMALSELMLLCKDYQKPDINLKEPEYTPFATPKLEEDYYMGKIKAKATKEQTGNTADRIVDKKFDDINGQRWSAQGYPNSVTLEFEEVLDLRKITVVPYFNRTYIYTIEASIDGENYNLIVENDGEMPAMRFIDHEIDTKAKYIRLTVTGCTNYTGDWISINEVLVYVID